MLRWLIFPRQFDESVRIIIWYTKCVNIGYGDKHHIMAEIKKKYNYFKKINK